MKNTHTIFVDVPILTSRDLFTYIVNKKVESNGKFSEVIVEQSQLGFGCNDYVQDIFRYWSSEFNRVLSRYDYNHNDVKYLRYNERLLNMFKKSLRVGWISKQVKHDYDEVESIIRNYPNATDEEIIKLIVATYTRYYINMR